MLVVDPPRRVLNPPCTHNTPDRISTEINYVAGHFRRRVELNIRVVPSQPIQPSQPNQP